jgi:hypothetical protein
LFVKDYDLLSLYSILLGTVIIYIPVTILYAIFSTFFETEEEGSSEILDD